MVIKMIDLCEQLHGVITEWRDKMAAKSSSPADNVESEIASTTVAMDTPHPRICISSHIQETILEWMGGVSVVRNSQSQS